ncbi:sugar phosphate isomerase/epimerase [Clostridium bowmanii]|uniref:sugar phosphate isomerase/epimerase family protein n=1 Tax=Clostridium bowmanii TaxID=132925 RepID=UPI001C0C4E24|nr:sugar phosphate isomerase/epimerase [Clostridium bowmanii]MBU3191031.1 sugar phosphate isomerase/epimerase [Clostridium bowmanii]MCA1075354.1 sugar phosphate isomerase/epimerase [Clostridium bowmanii]
MLNKLSAQLWSVQDYTSKDFFGTLEEISRMGYTGVEFAGYKDILAKDMNKKLKELNLIALSAHVGLDNLKENLDAELEYLNTLGAKYIVCPHAEINTVESAMKHAELFNRIGEQSAKAGLIFAYHNHAHEFKLDNGQYPLEVMFNNTNLRYVKQQPDVFWVAYAGLDVNEYMKKNISRCPVVHLKQLENNETKKNVDAGSGIIDFKYLIDLAPNADYVYEQEEFVGTSLDNMKKSFKDIMNR